MPRLPQPGRCQRILSFSPPIQSPAGNPSGLFLILRNPTLPVKGGPAGGPTPLSQGAPAAPGLSSAAPVPSQAGDRRSEGEVEESLQAEPWVGPWASGSHCAVPTYRPRPRPLRRPQSRPTGWVGEVQPVDVLEWVCGLGECDIM